MGKTDGIFVLETHTNQAAKLAALGLSEADVKRYMDPKNCVRMIFTETSPECLEIKTTMSNLPEFDNTVALKLGERTVLNVPSLSMAITMTKRNENTYMFKTEMKDVVMDEVTVFHSYGFSVTGTVAGVSFADEYKRLDCNVSGYYIYDSGTGMDDVFKWFDLPFGDVNEFVKDGGFRIVEKEGGVWVEELFGGSKKEYFAKFDEEIDYERSDWNLSDKRITTKLGPGVFKTVCRSKKDGKVWDWTLTFSDAGLTVETNAGGFKATEYYKRGCDMSGTWRTVSYTGGEGYAAALGMSGENKAKYISQSTSYKYEVERLPCGVIQIKSNSPWTPGGVLNIKSGESWTYDIPQAGTVENIGHEGPNTWTMVTRISGKTITIKEKYSGNFAISEAVVDNIRSSTAITIFTRD